MRVRDVRAVAMVLRPWRRNDMSLGLYEKLADLQRTVTMLTRGHGVLNLNIVGDLKTVVRVTYQFGNKVTTASATRPSGHMLIPWLECVVPQMARQAATLMEEENESTIEDASCGSAIEEVPEHQL
jgi:hypothetical protein